jgi:uncharacterized protein YjbJ (UPF0337 family)
VKAVITKGAVPCSEYPRKLLHHSPWRFNRVTGKYVALTASTTMSALKENASERTTLRVSVELAGVIRIVLGTTLATRGVLMLLTKLSLAFCSMLVTTSGLLAQTPAPAPSGTATGGVGGISWLWIIVLLAVLGAAVWYFGFRNRSSTSSTNSMGVDRDRVAGSAQQAKGSVKEGLGSMTGDTKLQAEGRMDKVEGKVQNTVGGIKDTLRDK